jgi:hypothetical protein
MTMTTNDHDSNTTTRLTTTNDEGEDDHDWRTGWSYLFCADGRAKLK